MEVNFHRIRKRVVERINTGGPEGGDATSLVGGQIHGVMIRVKKRKEVKKVGFTLSRRLLKISSGDGGL